MRQNKRQCGAALKEKLKKKYGLGGVTLWGVVLFAALLVFDLLTKALAEKFLADGTEINLLGGLICLRLVYNRGISFGMFSESSAGAKIAIIAVTAVMMLGLAVLYAFIDKRRKPLRIALIFIVAGGIGNLIDRILFRIWLPSAPKGVRDMVDVSAIRFGSFNFGICNFADFFITAGAIMLVLAFLFFDADAVFPSAKSKKLAEALAAEKEGDAPRAETTEKAAAETAADGRVRGKSAEYAESGQGFAAEEENADNAAQGGAAQEAQEAKHGADDGT